MVSTLFRDSFLDFNFLEAFAKLCDNREMIHRSFAVDMSDRLAAYFVTVYDLKIEQCKESCNLRLRA